MARFFVRYGETTEIVSAGSKAEAFDLVRDSYELEFGTMAFDQYDVKVDSEEELEAADRQREEWLQARARERLQEWLDQQD